MRHQRGHHEQADADEQRDQTDASATGHARALCHMAMPTPSSANPMPRKGGWLAPTTTKDTAQMNSAIAAGGGAQRDFMADSVSRKLDSHSRAPDSACQASFTCRKHAMNKSQP